MWQEYGVVVIVVNEACQLSRDMDSGGDGLGAEQEGG